MKGGNKVEKTYVTPIVKSVLNKTEKNNIFYKREDLLPFSFGGNKVRIALKFFEDMQEKGKDCIITYGNSRSNLSRVIANMAAVKGIPCCVVSPNDDDDSRIETNNSKMVKLFNARIVTCSKENVSETVKAILDEYTGKGFKPYYIYGNEYGKGNEATPVRAYVEVYNEILQQEKSLGIQFDYIFHASGTGMTQAGLICANIIGNQNKKIIGCSIARKAEVEIPILKRYVLAYLENSGKMISPIMIEKNIHFWDKYLGEGYGKYNNLVLEIISQTLCREGMFLDAVYTGKAFYGMKKYIEEKNISGKNILFLHTGSAPLFFEKVDEL